MIGCGELAAVLGDDPARHGLLRVAHQVQQHLLDLVLFDESDHASSARAMISPRRVAEDTVEIPVQVTVQRTLLAEQSLPPLAPVRVARIPANSAHPPSNLLDGPAGERRQRRRLLL